MATVKDILEFVQTLAPLSYKMEWDNVGLNCGHLDQPVRKILVALDPFDHVCREAKDFGADLLLTHHALLWEPGFITDINMQGKNALFLIENRIAHINAHTNLDCAPGGVNDTLAKVLGLSGVQVVPDTENLLRCGTVPSQDLSAFLSCVKDSLGCEGLRYVDSGKKVSKVAVGGGSCAGAMQEAIKAGCDTFVTADIKYNQFHDAHDLGINLVDAGHFHTENPICAVLASKIQAAFPEIDVKLSVTHFDPMKFF
jgi:dinuclear metal center YbgI/SA1388 family protein